MKNTNQENIRKSHFRVTEASPWVKRFAPLIPKHGPSEGEVLDLAAGNGRNGRYIHTLGYSVTVLDRDVSSLDGITKLKNVRVIQADLETNDHYSNIFADEPEGNGVLSGKTFAGVVVINYLHRPILKNLIQILEPGGVLIYETFARGNEDFVRPRNPDHLLKSGELLELAKDQLQVVSYEHGKMIDSEIEGVKQRLCAIKDLAMSAREDGEPTPHLVP
ncbi:MAG: methyltransferase domain-containing protein [Pseudomonadota bacterium]|nr:methyltransferase domain-containing protein [Pseudomonadota bacterium]